MTQKRIEIAIADQQRHIRLPRRPLQTLIRRVLKGEDVHEAEISLALVDDAAIARLNWQFLKHTGPTDVITFPLTEAAVTALQGEIVVSTETAARVAARLGRSPVEETHLYLVHGLLHLCGYDDHGPSDRRRMRRRERHYLPPGKPLRKVGRSASRHPGGSSPRHRTPSI